MNIDIYSAYVDFLIYKLILHQGHRFSTPTCGIHPLPIQCADYDILYSYSTMD